MAAVFRFALSQPPLSLPSKTITWSCESAENRRVWPNDKHNQVFDSYLIAFTLTPENFFSVLCGKRAFRPRDLVSSPRLAENRVTHRTLFFHHSLGQSLSAYSATLLYQSILCTSEGIIHCMQTVSVC